MKFMRGNSDTDNVERPAGGEDRGRGPRRFGGPEGRGMGGGPHRGEGLPPHILHELMEMKEKIGKLEGMVEVLMKKLN